ncbi:MAG: hypothetical protein O7G83_11780 [Proteobacteria bacterium]|nr:hypothetical protein [Pseudomonadota bacterium]MCZ6892472.1 hypothetical protein [Gammaproteobacteria bacterium]
MERSIYDEDGQLMDCAAPRASQTPELTLNVLGIPLPSNNHAIKSIAQSETIGASPTLMNASLAALVPLGFENLDVPCMSESIWRARPIAETTEQQT